MNWKAVGLAGIAGVMATGLVVRKRRREWSDPTADELRETLRKRVDEDVAETGSVTEAALDE